MWQGSAWRSRASQSFTVAMAFDYCNGVNQLRDLEVSKVTGTDGLGKMGRWGAAAVGKAEWCKEVNEPPP